MLTGGFCHIVENKRVNEWESITDLTRLKPKITEAKAQSHKHIRFTTDELPEDLPVEIIESKLPEKKQKLIGMRNISVTTKDYLMHGNKDISDREITFIVREMIEKS